MAIHNKKQIPIREGLWAMPSSPDEKPQLIGSKCPSCGEVFFPKNEICINCQYRPTEEIKLNRRGKIYSVSMVMLAPKSHYAGPVPYAMGFVELPEGVRVLTGFSGDPEPLEIGTEVELVIEKLREDNEGNEVTGYKFRRV